MYCIFKHDLILDNHIKVLKLFSIGISYQQISVYVNKYVVREKYIYIILKRVDFIEYQVITYNYNSISIEYI